MKILVIVLLLLTVAVVGCSTTAEYDKAIRLNPNDAEAYYDRGLALNELGFRAEAEVERLMAERAIEDFDAVIRLEPNWVKAYYIRGIIYGVRLGEYERAIENFDEVIRLNPRDANAYLWRGKAYDALGEYERAIEDFDLVIYLLPEHKGHPLAPFPNYELVPAYNNRGFALYNLGEYERAIDDFDEVIRINPRDAIAYLSRGKAYDALGEHQRAIQDYKSQAAIDEDRNEALRLASRPERLPFIMGPLFVLGVSSLLSLLVLVYYKLFSKKRKTLAEQEMDARGYLRR